jgi:hypothetical protein
LHCALASCASRQTRLVSRALASRALRQTRLASRTLASRAGPASRHAPLSSRTHLTLAPPFVPRVVRRPCLALPPLHHVYEFHWVAASRGAQVCNHTFHAFQMYVAYVSSGCCKSRSGVAYVAWLYVYVAIVCFKCFNCFKCMLQVLYLDVAYVIVAIHIGCKCMFKIFQLFQKYVTSVSSGCCICCSSYAHFSYFSNNSIVGAQQHQTHAGACNGRGMQE